MKKLLALLAFLSFSYSISYAAGEVDANLPDQETHNIPIVKEYLSAEFAAKNNDFDNAAILFESALAKRPNDALLTQNVYKYMLLAGNNEKAAVYAEKYLQFDQHAASALIILATKAVSQGEFAKASQILDDVVQDKKKQPITGIEQLIIPFLRLWIIAGEGNYDVALNMLDPKDSSSLISGSFIALQKAVLLSIFNHNLEATQTFADLINTAAVMPYNVAKTAASFYESIGKWDEAGAIYTKYRLEHPSLPHFEHYDTKIANKITSGLYIKNPIAALSEVMLETARLLFTNQLYNEGLFYVRLALILSPGNDEANMLLASYYEENANFAKALGLYNSISTESDFYIISQISKAENLYKNNAKKQAKQLLLTLAKQIQTKYIPLVTLADLYRRDNQYVDAIATYKMVLENIDSKNKASWAIFFARGMCYERIGQWQKAESDMVTALELNPDQPEIVNYLAYSWIQHDKNLEKARDMLLKAAVKRPNDPQILDSAGWALYKLSDYKNAVIFLEKSVELLPNDPVINDHL